MGSILLGLGDLGATRTPGDVLVTMALGSCIALIARDPATKTVGMAHIVLPEGGGLPGANNAVGYYADTAIPALFDLIQRVGGPPKGRGLQIRLVGGASLLDPNGTFSIGKRNALAIKKLLWRHNLAVLKEDLGGDISRTVRVDVDTGGVLVSSPGRANWTL